MKIFLLNPNFNLEKKSVMNVRFRQPLDLAYVTSILRNDGGVVRLLDANVLDLSNKDVLRNIDDYRPEILIVSTSPVDRWECPHTHLENIFDLIDKAPAKYKIIVGSHGTTQPEWVLKQRSVDFVVRGEPEMIIRELVTALGESKDLYQIKGISWRTGGSIIHNLPAERIIDLDSLPMPAYDLLPMEKYSSSDFEKPFSIMLTSRGCPYNCTFCLKAMMPGKFVARSPENVLNEIKLLINKFKVKSIYFQDWEFLIDLKRVENICQLIIDNNFKFKWGCNARASDIANNPALIRLMQEAGCIKINMGLESGSDEILSNIKKQLTKNDLSDAIKVLRENDIEPGFYMLLNCPGENSETLKETANFIVDEKIRVKSVNPVVPYPGTALYDELKQKDGEVAWDKVEIYAGQVRTIFSPNRAKWLLRHYKWQRKFGKYYWLKIGFWKDMAH